jgi:hypothetical protein
VSGFGFSDFQQKPDSNSTVRFTLPESGRNKIDSVRRNRSASKERKMAGWLDNIGKTDSATPPSTPMGSASMDALILQAGLEKAKENVKHAEETAIAALANKVNS